MSEWLFDPVNTFLNMGTPDGGGEDPPPKPTTIQETGSVDMGPRIRLGKVYHLHQPPFMKHEENSFVGIDNAARLGYDSIDLDILDKWNCHWYYPMREDGFHDPLGLVHPDTGLFDMTEEEIRRLEVPGKGIKIHDMPTQYRRCRLRRLKVRNEVKCGPHPLKTYTLDYFKNLKAEQDAAGVKGVMTTLDNYSSWRTVLQRAHDAGWQTFKV